MRCHSMPGRALTCPEGWLAEDLRRAGHHSSQHQDTQRQISAHSASLHDGSWSDLQGTLRPSTTAFERCPGGGRTQGARSMRPMSQGAASNYVSEYNPEKHGWHDPRGQMETMRLREDPQGRSWSWTMRKARDHLGYGESGSITWGDVQTTAVSGDGPDWFVGTKTVPGPFSTKTVPVRRSPWVQIEGQTMRARGKTYTQGENLDIHETVHETNKVPVKSRSKAPDGPMATFNKAKYCSLMHGGCRTKPDPMPPSRMVIKEGRTQRF